MKAPRGTRDILPGEIGKWHFVEGKIAEFCRLFGYEEIRTPVFEHTELFLRGVGEATDIVSKEMYTFVDRGERSVTLRPENTAPVTRAFMEHKMYGDTQPVKLYYVAPMFRYDRPQAGRYRQFHQFGVEVLGTQDPTVDAEVMSLALSFFRGLGLSEFELQVNSVGCPRCRNVYRKLLQEQLKEKVAGLCPDCVERYDKNPLRILDCKVERCREVSGAVPLMLDNLCNECDKNFETVKRSLDKLGEKYVVNPRLVRGLDYYTKTAFEIISPALGAQSSIGGGGRYDNLLAEIGGPDTPATGFAIGLERVLLAMDAAAIQVPQMDRMDVFVATAGEVSGEDALKLAMELRHQGLAVEKDYMGRSLKAQLKYADKKNARFLVILGDEEIKSSMVTVRDMSHGEQKSVKIENLAVFIREAKR